MKIVIEIPKEFEKEYLFDKFKNSLERIQYDIEKGVLCGRYEKEVVEMLIKSFNKSCVPEPQHENFLLKMQGDEFDLYRKEYNEIIKNYIK